MKRITDAVWLVGMSVSTVAIVLIVFPGLRSWAWRRYQVQVVYPYRTGRALDRFQRLPPHLREAAWVRGKAPGQTPHPVE